MIADVFDARLCELGEGPLWHPERKQLFWFDILNKRLLTANEAQSHYWQFDEHVSAAGWVDVDHLLVASETSLFLFDATRGQTINVVADLEKEQPHTRSNDGRADPYGGFWIGTMGKRAEAGQGAIYRWYKGELKTLYGGMTIPNAICFSPDGDYAYFTDTPTRRIMRQALDAEGWPQGAADLFVDLSDTNFNPDGAVVDVQGCLWNAQWGASHIARYSSEGAFLQAYELPARQVSCPAFGGANMRTLYATTAREGMDQPRAADGATYVLNTAYQGQREHRINMP